MFHSGDRLRREEQRRPGELNYSNHFRWQYRELRLAVSSDCRIKTEYLFYNRVVHGWHFWPIFHSFFIHFQYHFDPIFPKNETENERKMKRKMNIFDKMEPCPRFCKKWSEKWSFFGFLAVFLTRKMHFYIIFLNFGFQGVHGNHFSHHFKFHFRFPFVCSSAKYTKWAKNEVKNEYKNGPKMSTVNNPNISK